MVDVGYFLMMFLKPADYLCGAARFSVWVN